MEFVEPLCYNVAKGGDDIMEKDKYKKIPISDSHMHLWREMPLADSVDFHSWVIKEFGYDTISLMAICEQAVEPTRAVMQNLKTMYLKKVLSPNVYAYSGLHFRELSPDDDGTYFLNQAKYIKACGYDGIKMFYPMLMYRTGFPYIKLSDSRFDKFFSYVEREQIPLTLHLGAPEVCFAENIEDVPLSQRKWYIGKAEHHLFEAFDDFKKMMDKFPKLKITVAHFAFITWHMDWAEEWLSKYENLHFDLTPSLFMYFDFQENPKEWKEFLIKHADRIIYGTDIGSNTLDVVKYEPGALCHVVRGFFEETEPIHEFEETFYPMPLPDDVLKKIYKENIMKCYGNKPPKKADYERLLEEIAREEAWGIETKLQAENIETMRAEF